MYRRQAHTLTLLLSVSVVTLMITSLVPVGYAGTSYTATSTSENNNMTASYGLVTFTDGTEDYPLNDILKTPFTTVKNEEVKITAGYKSAGTFPNQLSLTFSFSYIRYSSNSPFNSVGVIVGTNAETTKTVGNNGSASITVTLDQAYLETITATNNIHIPITIKVYNSQNSARTLDNNASVSISVSTGSLDHSTVSLAGKNVPAKSNNVNGCFSLDRSILWIYNSLTYSDFHLHYEHFNPTDNGNGTVSITFNVSKLNVLNNQTLYVTLGLQTKSVTISNTSGVVGGSITFSALELQSGFLDSVFHIDILSNGASTKIGTYSVTITASYNSCSAVNLAELDTIVSSDDAVNNMLDSNPSFGTDESDYNMSTTPAGNHGNHPAVNISNENNRYGGISDGSGNVELEFVVPQGAAFVIYLTTSGSNTFTIHMERGGEVLIHGTVTFNSGSYYSSMQYYLSSVSYDGSSSGYFYDTLSKVNQYSAWMTGSTADITVSIYTSDGQNASNNLKMDIVFDSD